MHLTHLPTSIEKTETSSGGALLNDFMMPWNPQTFNMPMSHTVGAESSPSLLGLSFKVQLESTSAKSLSDSFKKRITLCFLLLSQIPDEALDEVTETMKEISNFYAKKADFGPKLQSSISRERSFTVEKRQIRPDFTLTED